MFSLSPQLSIETSLVSDIVEHGVGVGFHYVVNKECIVPLNNCLEIPPTIHTMLLFVDTIY